MRLGWLLENDADALLLGLADGGRCHGAIHRRAAYVRAVRVAEGSDEIGE